MQPPQQHQQQPPAATLHSLPPRIFLQDASGQIMQPYMRPSIGSLYHHARRENVTNMRHFLHSQQQQQLVLNSGSNSTASGFLSRPSIISSDAASSSASSMFPPRDDTNNVTNNNVLPSQSGRNSSSTQSNSNSTNATSNSKSNDNDTFFFKHARLPTQEEMDFVFLPRRLVRTQLRVESRRAVRETIAERDRQQQERRSMRHQQWKHQLPQQQQPNHSQSQQQQEQPQRQQAEPPVFKSPPPPVMKGDWADEEATPRSAQSSPAAASPAAAAAAAAATSSTSKTSNNNTPLASKPTVAAAATAAEQNKNKSKNSDIDIDLIFSLYDDDDGDDDAEEDAERKDRARVAKMAERFPTIKHFNSQLFAALTRPRVTVRDVRQASGARRYDRRGTSAANSSKDPKNKNKSNSNQDEPQQAAAAAPPPPPSYGAYQGDPHHVSMMRQYLQLCEAHMQGKTLDQTAQSRLAYLHNFFVFLSQQFQQEQQQKQEREQQSQSYSYNKQQQHEQQAASSPCYHFAPEPLQRDDDDDYYYYCDNNNYNQQQQQQQQEYYYGFNNNNATAAPAAAAFAPEPQQQQAPPATTARIRVIRQHDPYWMLRGKNNNSRSHNSGRATIDVNNDSKIHENTNNNDNKDDAGAAPAAYNGVIPADDNDNNNGDEEIGRGLNSTPVSLSSTAVGGGTHATIAADPNLDTSNHQQQQHHVTASEAHPEQSTQQQQQHQQQVAIVVNSNDNQHKYKIKRSYRLPYILIERLSPVRYFPSEQDNNKILLHRIHFTDETSLRVIEALKFEQLVEEQEEEEGKGGGGGGGGGGYNKNHKNSQNFNSNSIHEPAPPFLDEHTSPHIKLGGVCADLAPIEIACVLVAFAKVLPRKVRALPESFGRFAVWLRDPEREIPMVLAAIHDRVWIGDVFALAPRSGGIKLLLNNNNNNNGGVDQHAELQQQCEQLEFLAKFISELRVSQSRGMMLPRHLATAEVWLKVPPRPGTSLSSSTTRQHYYHLQ